MNRTVICWISLFLGVLCGLARDSAVFGADHWSTYRGNSQRTGNTDDVAGPKSPKVLWALKSQEHYIAAPVPFGDRVYVAGLGAFNVSTFHSLAIDLRAPERIAW